MYMANVGATDTNAMPMRMIDEKAPLLYRLLLSSPVHGKLIVDITDVLTPDLFACKLNMELVKAFRIMPML